MRQQCSTAVPLLGPQVRQFPNLSSRGCALAEATLRTEEVPGDLLATGDPPGQKVHAQCQSLMCSLGAGTRDATVLLSFQALCLPTLARLKAPFSFAPVAVLQLDPDAPSPQVLQPGGVKTPQQRLPLQGVCWCHPLLSKPVSALPAQAVPVVICLQHED